MKKIIIAFVLILSAFSLNATKPFHTSVENQKKYIKIAREVAAKVAPDYDLSGLIPKLFIFDSMPKEYIDRHNGNQVIMVAFMSDTTSNGYKVSCKLDHKTKKVIKKKDSPRFELCINIWENTFEPQGVTGNYGVGVGFNPDYETFLRENHDFKMKKDSLSSDPQILY